MIFDHTIKQPAWSANCDKEEKVRLCTDKIDGHLNIYLEANGAPRSTVCIHPTAAKQLRDSLNELYPPEDPDQDLERFLEWDVGYTQALEDISEDMPQANAWQPVTIDSKGAGHTYRLPVPGGWFYRTVTYRYPELHLLMEDGHFDYDVGSRLHQRAMEIVAQNITFVPDNG